MFLTYGADGNIHAHWRNPGGRRIFRATDAELEQVGRDAVTDPTQRWFLLSGNDTGNILRDMVGQTNTGANFTEFNDTELWPDLDHNTRG